MWSLILCKCCIIIYIVLEYNVCTLEYNVYVPVCFTSDNGHE